MYFHIWHYKRSKLDPSGRKGTFVCYSETSKGYRIYIFGQRKIKISRDVTFDEEAAFRRSRESHLDKDREEPEAPPINVMRDSTLLEEHEKSDGHELQIDPPREETVSRNIPAWLQDTL